MIRRALAAAALGAAALALAGPVFAQGSDDEPVVVIDVRNPMDQRLMDFVAATLANTEAHLFVLQVDSPGIASGKPGALYEAIAEAPAPVVAWVGGRPAVAFGGAAGLLNIADVGAAAPATEIGYLEPTVAGSADVAVPYRPSHDPAGEDSVDELRAEAVVVEEPIPGYVDVVVPTIGQLITGLDGTTVTRGSGDDAVTFVISTAAERTTPDGGVEVIPSRDTLFVKPSLWDRFLRLAARPEAAFFFLVIAMAAATFEFYAAGPGITAAIAAVAFLLGGYGLAVLPVRWPAVAATVAGLLLYTWDFQRNRIGWRSIAGTALLVLGGLFYTDARPQFAPSWWVVLIVIAGVALFYAVALTTIVRSRFSTTTIGRDRLIGRSGVADDDLEPEGVVVVDGARWRARSHREAGIGRGDPVVVEAIDGIVLMVAPDAAPEARE